jgi:hypothetical protein
MQLQIASLWLAITFVLTVTTGALFGFAIPAYHAWKFLALLTLLTSAVWKQQRYQRKKFFSREEFQRWECEYFLVQQPKAGQGLLYILYNNLLATYASDTPLEIVVTGEKHSGERVKRLALFQGLADSLPGVDSWALAKEEVKKKMDDFSHVEKIYLQFHGRVTELLVPLVILSIALAF